MVVGQNECINKNLKCCFSLSFLVMLYRMPGELPKKHLNMIQGCQQEKYEYINFTVKTVHKIF